MGGRRNELSIITISVLVLSAKASALSAFEIWSQETSVPPFSVKVLKIRPAENGLLQITIPLKITYIDSRANSTLSLNREDLDEIEHTSEQKLNAFSHSRGLSFNVQINSSCERDHCFHVLVAPVFDPIWSAVGHTLGESDAGVACAFRHPVYSDNPSGEAFSSVVPYFERTAEVLAHEIGHFAFGHPDGYVRANRRTRPLPGLENFNAARSSNSYHPLELETFFQNLRTAGLID